MKNKDIFVAGSVGVLVLVVTVSFMVVLKRTPVGVNPVAPSGAISALAECVSAPVGSDIGSVRYPISRKYANLRGLGMVLTADDCGEARLAELAEGFTYSLEGGSLTLKAAPSPGLLEALLGAEFACGSERPDYACKSWRLNGDKVSPTDLIKLKPFVEEIESEDCSSCG